MAGKQHQVVPIVMPGTPAAGQLFQTNAINELVKIDTTGADDGWVLVLNTTTGLYELRSAGAASVTGLKFSLAFPFIAAGDFFDVPIGRFGSTVKAWAARLSASGDADWTVESSPDATSAFVDMVGAGTAPAVAGAIGVLDTDVTDWDVQTLAADAILRVTCTTLTVAQATLTLHFERA